MPSVRAGINRVQIVRYLIWYPRLHYGRPSLSAMSRAPPFPTRRGRSPSFTNGTPTISGPISAPTPSMPTRPLQIGRTPSRPTTPGNSNSTTSTSTSPRAAPPNTAPIGPSRPQRSELRNRASNISDSASSYRDSMSTTRSDYSLPSRSRQPGMPQASSSRPTPPRLKSAGSINGSETTPPALSSVLSAFKSAGRERAMTNGSDDFDYQRERREELEAERIRQQKIREKVPGRRTNGRARTGDIDGASFPSSFM